MPRLLNWLSYARSNLKARTVSQKKPVSKPPYVLIFAPEWGIDLYTETLQTVADALRVQGYTPLYVHCFKDLPRCILMETLSAPERISALSREKTCTICTNRFDRYQSETTGHVLSLKRFMKRSDAPLIRQALRHHTDWLSFEWGGLALGKIAFYNLALSRKVSPQDVLTKAEKALFADNIVSAYLVYQAVSRMLDAYDIKAVVGYGIYGAQMMAKLAAERRGIVARSLFLDFHNGYRDKALRVLHTHMVADEKSILDAWPNLRQHPLSQAMMKSVVDDSLTRLSAQGSYAYSPSKTLQNTVLEDLGIPADKQLIVAYTSSMDEVHALWTLAEGMGWDIRSGQDAYSTQIQWLDDLIAYVSDKPDIYLVIRFHPRHGKNAREPVESRELQHYRAHYDNVPHNVKIVWPLDKVSSYDLAECCDVATVGWTTLGLELARLGVPVITAIHYYMCFPEEALLSTAHTPAGYISKLNEALATTPCTWDTLKMIYRWYYIFAMSTGMPLHAPKDTLGPLLQEVLVEGKPLYARNQADFVRQSTSAEAEALAGQQQLARLIHYLFTGEQKSVTHLNVQQADGALVYQVGSKRYSRHSKMVKRLYAVYQSLSQAEAIAS